MVSNASEDLPEPDRPVITVSDPRGIATVMSFRLCSRAPETTSCSTSRSLVGRTDVPLGRFSPSAEKSALDAGVNLVEQPRAIREREVLGQIAVGLLARRAIQRH